MSRVLFLGAFLFVLLTTATPIWAQNRYRESVLSQSSWALWEQMLSASRCTPPTGPCDLTAGTTVGGVAIGGGGVSDGDKGDVPVTGSGASWAVDSGAINFSELAGAATDGQIPNTITVDRATLATTATTANAGDSATAFFSSGTLEGARGGVGTALPTCSGTDKLTANGTVVSCATDQTGGGGGAGYAEIVAAGLAGF